MKQRKGKQILSEPLLKQMHHPSELENGAFAIRINERFLKLKSTQEKNIHYVRYSVKVIPSSDNMDTLDALFFCLF